jgi:hypothetical protein
MQLDNQAARKSGLKSITICLVYGGLQGNGSASGQSRTGLYAPAFAEATAWLPEPPVGGV